MPTTEQEVVSQLRQLVAQPSVSSPDPHWDASNRGVCLLYTSDAADE